VTSKPLLVLFALAAAGCRSDGGIDRRDCQQGMNFTLRALAQQTKDDIAETSALVTSLPGSFSRATSQSVTNLRDTYTLYFDTHEAR
jgi:hypothetical protein